VASLPSSALGPVSSWRLGTLSSRPRRRVPSGVTSVSALPKLLFLAWPFPPFRAIGCVRGWSIAKYLARIGWDVTVVTPHPSLWRQQDRCEQVAEELEREGIRRILTGHRWQGLLPGCFKPSNHGFRQLTEGIGRRVARSLAIDPAVGWVGEADRACAGLSSGDVDLILATGSPFVAFGLARRLARRLNCPYVLDYRDPWTGNPHSGRPDRPAAVREEARLLAGCAAVTIVSEAWAAALDARFHLGPKLHVVTNGYDPEDLSAVRPQRFGHFSIVYTGSFYPPKRVIHPVMAALQRLNSMPDRPPVVWRFHYFGPHEAHVLDAARQFGELDQVVSHGQVARQEALSAIRGADVAVVITSVTDESGFEDQGIVTGKLFEAVGLGTPTLLIAPAGSNAEMVVQSTGLAGRFSGSDCAGIAAFLRDVMLGRAPGARHAENYGWPRIAQKMDSVLRNAAGVRTPIVNRSLAHD
jgi:glycosyltransferase involved in cell wall biosynthesis